MKVRKNSRTSAILDRSLCPLSPSSTLVLPIDTSADYSAPWLLFSSSLLFVWRLRARITWQRFRTKQVCPTTSRHRVLARPRSTLAFFLQLAWPAREASLDSLPTLVRQEPGLTAASTQARTQSRHSRMMPALARHRLHPNPSSSRKPGAGQKWALRRLRLFACLATSMQALRPQEACLYFFTCLARRTSAHCPRARPRSDH